MLMMLKGRKKERKKKKELSIQSSTSVAGSLIYSQLICYIVFKSGLLLSRSAYSLFSHRPAKVNDVTSMLEFSYLFIQIPNYPASHLSLPLPPPLSLSLHAVYLCAHLPRQLNCVFPVMLILQTGHMLNSSAHAWQETLCPHGWKVTSAGLSLQKRQVLTCLSPQLASGRSFVSTPGCTANSAGYAPTCASKFKPELGAAETTSRYSCL